MTAGALQWIPAASREPLMSDDTATYLRCRHCKGFYGRCNPVGGFGRLNLQGVSKSCQAVDSQPEVAWLLDQLLVRGQSHYS